MTPVGIGELRVSSSPDEVLVALGLGSCIALSAWDPVARVGGMVHCQLPSPRLHRDQSLARPGTFPETAVPLLLRKLEALEAHRARLVVKMVGAATTMSPQGADLFRIGQRNEAAMRKALWQHDLVASGADLGGSGPRTFYLYLRDGSTVIRSQGETWAI